MMKRYMIHEHRHVITATRIQRKGGTNIFDPMLRFQSSAELVDHFTAQGVPYYALEAAQESLDFTGKATLTFFAAEELPGSSRTALKRKRM